MLLELTSAAVCGVSVVLVHGHRLAEARCPGWARGGGALGRARPQQCTQHKQAGQRVQTRTRRSHGGLGWPLQGGKRRGREEVLGLAAGGVRRRETTGKRFLIHSSLSHLSGVLSGRRFPLL